MKLFLTLFLTISSLVVSRAQCDVNVREAFGGISSITIYNTYLSIGAIADSYVNEVYDADRVKDLMSEQMAMLESVIDMLSKCTTVKSDGLTNDDVLFVEELIDCMKSLQKEAQGLSDYAVTGSEEAQNRYNINRDKAWQQISDILGLE